MHIGGILVLALVIVICAYLVPTLASKRQAVVESREGDRFSEAMRLVGTPTHLPPARHERPIQARLLASSVDEGMDVESTAARRPASPTGRQKRLTNAATRELSSLRAGRASRLASEAAAAKRRLVTFCVALFAFLVVLALGLAGLVNWWWLSVPSLFLVGSAVASRMAAIRTEKSNQRYESRLDEIRRDAPVRYAAPVSTEQSQTRRAAFNQAEHHADPVAISQAIEAVKVEIGSGQTDEPSVAASESVTAEAEPGGSWDVSPLPKPSYLLKETIARRSVRVDTSVTKIPQVAAVPARPVAASSADEAPVTFTFDLNAVLEARRAQ